MASNARVLNATKAREQRVIAIGAIVVVAGLLLAYVILPFARQWYTRSQEIRALRAQSDTLAGLVASASQLESAATTQERTLAASNRRVLHARSSTLAASSLQSLLQDAADASHLVVTRLDVAQSVADGVGTESAPGASTDTSTSPSRGEGRSVALPATLAAYCDIVGLAALLDHLARAPRVVYVERLTVQQNSSLRGAPDMLQVTLSLRAPVVIE